MTDTELIVHFRSLAEDYNRKATYRKGQELAHLLKERKRRKLLEKMSDTELNDFIWFEDDTIAEWLGYNDFDEIMNRSEEEK